MVFHPTIILLYLANFRDREWDRISLYKVKFILYEISLSSTWQITVHSKERKKWSQMGSAKLKFIISGTFRLWAPLPDLSQSWLLGLVFCVEHESDIIFLIWGIFSKILSTLPSKCQHSNKALTSKENINQLFWWHKFIYKKLFLQKNSSLEFHRSLFGTCQL